MTQIFERMLNVNPGTKLVFRLGPALQPDGKQSDHPVQEHVVELPSDIRRVKLEILEQHAVQAHDTHSTASPELGRPTLTVNEPDPATQGIKTR